MDKNKQLDKVRGSLIGGAVGDALGYPVEFIYSYMDIKKRYGESGITRMDTTQWWLLEGGVDGKAWISDDAMSPNSPNKPRQTLLIHKQSGDIISF